MNIQTERRGDVTVLTCQGPLTVPDGKAAFLGALEDRLAQGDTKFVFDFREVPYMDSPTIGAMMSCFKRAIDGGGGVKLALSGRSKVREILELTGLDAVVEIYEDPADAVTSFGAAGA